MDRFDVIRFSDLTGPKGDAKWPKIGGRSFGVVFKGEYLGTQVAIKEVLPNNTYDVEKYFERECVLMKEARHPNIVQYIGLTKGPGSDGRIYIVSEFVGPNLRRYIADKTKPFDWQLRLSFATDIARAVAYLHARNCMHRDLKGENLLITDNQRIKVCDFGFARIAARNEEEMRRISYCGTDGYMSPEILMGVDFSLPSDVFSLGVIFCEIISRHLVDSTTFKREMPSFGLDTQEIREMASPDCPADFITLCIEMTRVLPEERPDMRNVIRRLRAIEQEVIQRESAKGTLTNVGSIRGSILAAVLNAGSTSKRKTKTNTRRIPSFNPAPTTAVAAATPGQETIVEESSSDNARNSSSDSSDDDDEEEAEEALRELEKITADSKLEAPGGIAETIKAASTFKAAGHGNPWWDEDSNGTLPEIPVSWLEQYRNASTDAVENASTIKANAGKPSQEDEYSTSVVRPSRQKSHPSLASSLSRMTGSKMLNVENVGDATESSVTVRDRKPLGEINGNKAPIEEAIKSPKIRIDSEGDSGETSRSFVSAHSTMTRQNHVQNSSFAMATVASSIVEATAMYHRFTLVKNGTRKPSDITASMTVSDGNSSNSPPASPATRLSYQLILANALTKCNVCQKRLGFGAYMDCDDCPYKTHVGCAAMAELTCQELQIPCSATATPPCPGSPLLHSSPLSAVCPVQVEARRSSASSAVAAANTSEDGSSSGGAKSVDRQLHSIKEDNGGGSKVKQSPSTPSSPRSTSQALSKGVGIFRKKNSKSPPPATAAPSSSVKV